MSDAVSITINVPEFQKALLEYEKAVTNHDLPYILNRAGRNVATKASKETPKATIAEIDAELAKPGYKKGWGPMLFVLTNARRKRLGQDPVGGQAMSGPAHEFLKKRHSSRAYIAAGWTPAIIKFGGHSRAHIDSKSKISKADNRIATASELVAILENTAEGAGKVGADALAKAMSATAADLLSFARKKLDDTSKRYSAK